jgi:hypothetical protein
MPSAKDTLAPEIAEAAGSLLLPWRWLWLCILPL